MQARVMEFVESAEVSDRMGPESAAHTAFLKLAREMDKWLKEHPDITLVSTTSLTVHRECCVYLFYEEKK